MILVDRTAVPLPPKIQVELKKAFGAASKFYKRTDRSQLRYVFGTQPWLKTRPFLDRLFDSTCAFCESPEGYSALQVEHFRPIAEASQLDGSSHSDWYWWLATEWENLYLVCQVCSHQKKNFFPVDGDRAPLRATGAELDRERNLLIDPCRDDPAQYLRFLDDGTVESTFTHADISSPGKLLDRGSLTIQVLALNRPELVQQRHQAAAEVLFTLEAVEFVRKTPSKKIPVRLTDALHSHVDEFGVFVAVKRQVIARRLTADPGLRTYLYRKAPDLKIMDRVLRSELKALRPTRVQAHKASLARAATTGGVAELAVEYDNAYVRRLQIKNFRAIEHLDIAFPELIETSAKRIRDLTQAAPAPVPAGSINRAEFRSGWKMLLGENASGKSTVLKALALALSGEKYYHENMVEYGLEPSQLLNKYATVKNGFIKVEMTKGDPIEITFTDRELHFTSRPEGAGRVFVRGFGAARLFSRKSKRDDRTDADPEPRQDVANLFQPDVLLANPEKWLAVIDRAMFNSTAISFRDLLWDLLNVDENPGSRDGEKKETKRILTKPHGKVMLDIGFGPLPLAAQSDGYNSILAFVVDILAGLPPTMRDKSNASGIIILDELDAHLHPRSKMRIVECLSSTFPSFQFIVSSHDPLCLRGLGKGEITIMKRFGHQVRINDSVPSTAGLRVDQLLTSELFGLQSTIDPEIDNKFYTYYKLLEEGDGGDQKRKDLIGKLETELSQYNTLGYTRRDQMVYRFVDEYIARLDRLETEGEKAKLLESTRQRVFDIWDMVKTRGARR